MPIGKRETAGAIMETCGHVDDLRRAWLVGARAGIGKRGVVDAVRMFVHEDPSQGWRRNRRLLVIRPPVATGEPTAIAEHLAHRNAPDPGYSPALIIADQRFVRRALVDLAGVADVRPDRTLDNIVGNIPVHARARKIEPARAPVASSRCETVFGSQNNVIVVV